MTLMITTEHTKKKVSRGNKVGLFFAAWVAVLHLGALIFVVGWVISIVLFDTLDSSIDTNRSWLVHALIGISVIGFILPLLWRVRRHLFAKYSIWALWVGLGIYIVILCYSVGAIMYERITAPVTTEQVAGVCSSPENQLAFGGDAVIPIATDTGFGTGFAIDDQGLVITAYHVIEGSSDLYVNYASGRVNLSIVQTALDYDLALLRIAQPTENHFTLSAQYSVTDKVYVYGYPGNTFTAGMPSVTSGVVSRILPLEDLLLTSDQAPDGLEMIQTDASINGGNSGGPLINACGVIGVVRSTSDYSELHEYVGVGSEEGIGYAVSSKTVSDVFQLPIDGKSPFQK